MTGEKNLITTAMLTEDEQRDFSSKGGKASGAARRRKKEMRELAKIMLDCEASSSMKEAIKKVFPDLADEDITVSAAILAKQADKAAKGDIKSAEFLRDTSGQKPTEKVDNVSSDGSMTPSRISVEKIEDRVKELLGKKDE